MSYFQISHETDDKEVGVYEQIKELAIPTPRSVREKYYDLDESRKSFLENLPSLSVFKLASKAKITDVLSCLFLSMNVGFIASKKCSNLIKKSNLTNHQFHSAKIIGIPDDLEYQFFYLIEETQKINYKKSVCCKTDLFGTEEGEPIEISSIDDFWRNNIAIQQAEPGSKLSFMEVYLCEQLDILRLPGNSRIFISEKLKNQFEVNQVSGVVYKPSKIRFAIEKS